MRSEKIKFANSSGYELDARIELPENGSLKGFVLIVKHAVCSLL